MKTILIATDFSKASRNASLYGVELAKELNANIILFNAFRIPAPAAALSVRISRYDIMMQTDKLLLDEADLLDPKRELIEVICDEGLAEDAILKIANEKKADFIITGMRGSGNNFTQTFGSTASSLAKKTNIPLIIVPEKVLYRNPDIMVFASDNLGSNKNMLEPLRAITQLFRSKLYVDKIVKSKNKECYELSDAGKNLRKVVEILDAPHQYSEDSDLRYISGFIENHDADMLVMMLPRHGRLERLFRKSEIKDMIFHTQIPLLVLPEVNSEIRLPSKKEAQNKILA